MKFQDLLNMVESEFDKRKLLEKYNDNQILVLIYNLANDSLLDEKLKDKITEFIRNEVLEFADFEIPEYKNDEQ